jgi:signal transduction histidine kinase
MRHGVEVTVTEGAAWSEGLALQIGRLLANPKLTVPDIVRGLVSLPGITGAQLSTVDQPEAGELHVAVGATHRFDLVGPGTGRPDTAQAVRLVAGVVAARLTEQVELDDFLTIASHELRTPLTSATSLLELLEDPEVPGTQRVTMVAALRRNTKRLGTIVEELLLIVRLASGRPLLTRREVLAASLPGARHLGEPTTLIGDPYWLEHMIRYVASGSSGVPRAEATPAGWTLTVERTEESSAGLGLALARAIALRHGGNLRVDGTTVTITLPAQRGSAAALPPPLPPP